jgi:hypothetical protein
MIGDGAGGSRGAGGVGVDPTAAAELRGGATGGRSKRPSHGESFASALKKSKATSSKADEMAAAELMAQTLQRTSFVQPQKPIDVTLASTGLPVSAKPVVARGTLEQLENLQDSARRGFSRRPDSALSMSSTPSADDAPHAADAPRPSSTLPTTSIATADDATREPAGMDTPAAPATGSDTQVRRARRDTIPDIAPPARAVSAQDLGRITIGSVRTVRDTAPAPVDAAPATTMVVHASGAISSLPAAAEAVPAAMAPAAPIERATLPPPIVESGSTPEGVVGVDGAELRLGSGEDALSLRITAEKHVVRVHATAANAAMADALVLEVDELRQALGAHGLELGELSTSTGGGSSASDGDSAGGGREASDADGPQEPRPVRRRGVRVVA